MLEPCRYQIFWPLADEKVTVVDNEGGGLSVYLYKWSLTSPNGPQTFTLLFIYSNIAWHLQFFFYKHTVPYLQFHDYCFTTLSTFFNEREVARYTGF